MGYILQLFVIGCANPRVPFGYSDEQEFQSPILRPPMSILRDDDDYNYFDWKWSLLQRQLSFRVIEIIQRSKCVSYGCTFHRTFAVHLLSVHEKKWRLFVVLQQVPYSILQLSDLRCWQKVGTTAQKITNFYTIWWAWGSLKF